MNLDKLAEMMAHGLDGIHADIKELKKKIDKGFDEVNKRLDTAFQPQLDDHAKRIKKLEEEVLI